MYYLEETLQLFQEKIWRRTILRCYDSVTEIAVQTFKMYLYFNIQDHVNISQKRLPVTQRHIPEEWNLQIQLSLMYEKRTE